MGDLLNDLDNAKEEVKAAADEVASAPKGAPELDRKRSELLRLSEDGEIEQSVKYLKKASMKVVDIRSTLSTRTDGLRRPMCSSRI